LAQRGTDQSIGAGADAARAEAGAASCCTSRGADASHAAARGVEHGADGCAQNAGSGFRAQDVGIGDVQVVTLDGDVEIILESESDGVAQGKVNPAVVHEGIDARGIGQVRWRQVTRRVGSERIGKVGRRLGKVHNGNRRGLRGVLRSWRGGRLLSATDYTQSCE
jgi:hypothetical protein